MEMSRSPVTLLLFSSETVPNAPRFVKAEQFSSRTGTGIAPVVITYVLNISETSAPESFFIKETYSLRWKALPSYSLTNSPKIAMIDVVLPEVSVGKAETTRNITRSNGSKETFTGVYVMPPSSPLL